MVDPDAGHITAAQARAVAAALGLTLVHAELPLLLKALQTAYEQGFATGYTAGVENNTKGT